MIFDDNEAKLNSLVVILIFLFLMTWWVIVNVFFRGQNSEANLIWITVYQLIAIIGFYMGLVSVNGGVEIISNKTLKLYTIALLFQIIGQSIFSFYLVVLHLEIPYPSLADLFYLGCTPVYLLAIISLQNDTHNKKTKRLARITAVFIALILWTILILFWVQTKNVIDLKIRPVLDVVYSFFGIFSSSLAAASLLVTRAYSGYKFRKAILLLSFAVIFQFTSDTYFNNAARLGSWVNGGVGDLLYFSTYFLVSWGLVQFVKKFVAIHILTVLLNSFFFVQFILSDSIDQFFSNSIILTASLVVSYFLVRRNTAEVNRREEIARLSALEESHSKLQELDKQKTEFLNIAAHQLRTPVSIIRNYISMLQDGDFGKVSPEIQGVLNNVYDSNQWLVRLADEFLDISRLESGQTQYNKSSGDIAQVARGVIADLAPKIKQKGLLLNDKIVQTLPAYFDNEKIRHVILNFLENAFKYTPAGTITVQLVAAADEASFSVIDTGIGFTADDSKNFFQKFRRGQNAHQIEVNTSTGLGLYICRMFVEGHGGTVWAKSEGLGKGSEFGFRIPLTAAPHPERLKFSEERTGV